MNINHEKSKLFTIALVLLLAISTIIVALPAVNAQSLIMNTSPEATYGGWADVDLNGPSEQMEGMKFAYKPPGATDFIITTDPPVDNEPGLPGERYVTDPGGDLDIRFTATDGMGDYEVKWVHPATGAESNVVTITFGPPKEFITYPFLGVVPNPVGVGQTVLFHVGLFQQLSSKLMGWEDMSITIEKPDGQTDTISDIKTDSTGGTGKTYVPNQVGTYLCQAHFPEQAITLEKMAPGIGVGSVMLASSSAVLELEVQADPIEYYPGHSLPSEYWTRPIDAQIREWYQISGSWLDSGNEFPVAVSGNADAPESAHILWAKPLTWGGVSGGESGEMAYSHGDAYEGKWSNRIIIDGILIYSHRTNDRPLYYTAVNLRTGEEIWKKVLLDNRSIAFGQKLVWRGQNHYAVYPYFWVTQRSTWHAFDPYTGEWEFTVENVPGGDTVFDDNGWLYRIDLSYSRGEGYIWSMTDCIVDLSGDNPGSGSWSPAGSFYGARHATIDADGVERAYISEFTFPTGLGNDRAMAFGDKVFGLEYSRTEIRTWAVSLEAGKEGTLLFDETWDAPADWEAGNIQIEFNAVNLEEGAAVFWVKDTLEYYAFSTDTGEYMWGPAEPEYYANYYGWTELLERPTLIWDGKYYSSGVGGIIYCYDLADGEVLWTYEADDPYQEYLLANNWWQFFLFIADGKLYTAHLEHSAIDPMPRGGPALCLDATTGDVIWRADGMFRSTRWGGRAMIGDSIIVGMDTYDNRIYAVGRGPSALTVEKPQAVAEVGSANTIHGTVMDVSPGTEDIKLKLRFPNGVPAVSDASMSDWMLYVYKQNARPTDANGVPVKIEVVTPSGGYQNLGTTTSDSYGNWAFGWCPEEAGTYMIIATFEGSAGYYGSTQTSYLTVADPIVPEEVDLTSLEEGQSNITTYILIILVIVIIALLVAIYSLLKSHQ